MPDFEPILCLPGLGGHRSVFAGYELIIASRRFEFVEIVNWPEAMTEIERLARKNGKIILLCHCYGAQLGLRLIEKMPSAVSRLIIIEPVFAQFYGLTHFLGPVWRGLHPLLQFTDRLGLRRKKFTYKNKIDYQKVSNYPVIAQPFFDMRWQNLTDYMGKLVDIADYKLPVRVDVKTLFILSPKGYLRDPEKKEKIFDVFANHDIIEISNDTHNIVTASKNEIAKSIEVWLDKNIS
jgi:pimeloyl-ACP methyl ester carboxylesterase